MIFQMMNKIFFINVKYVVDNNKSILYNNKKWIVIVSVQARPVYTKIKINLYLSFCFCVNRSFFRRGFHENWKGA